MAGPEGNSFELVARGDRTQRPALMENELRRMLRDRRTSVPGASIGAILAGDTSQTVVYVENTVYNTNYSRGEVIGLGDLSITPTDNPAAWDQPITMEGVEVEENSAYGIWLESANYGELARAVIYGLAVTQVNMKNANDTWADVGANQTYLQSNAVTGSAQILWSESWGTANTGLKRAVVRLGNQRPRWITFHISPIGATTGLGNGKYFAESVALPTTPADFSPSGNMTDLEIGPTVAGADCIVMNMLEYAHSNSGHDLVDDINTGAWAIYGVGEWIHNTVMGNTTYKVLRAAQFWKGCQ